MGRSEEVDAWFEAYDNPMKPVVQRMREIILAADARMGECIKWKSPTFTYEGNLASFNPRSKSHASLMFHTGASIPGEFASFEGSGDTARFIKVASLEAADALRGELEAIVAAWVALKSGGGKAKKKATKKKATKKKATKKKATKKK